MKKITTKQITFVAVLSAIYVILSYLSIGTNDFNVSIKPLAIIIGALSLGPAAGFSIGLLGEFLAQLFSPYPLDITTPLWLLPYALMGLIVGLMAYKTSGVSKKRIILTCIIAELSLTILITPVNAISAIIQGWGNWLTILAGIPGRLLVMAARIVIDILIVPFLYVGLKKVVKKL